MKCIAEKFLQAVGFMLDDVEAAALQRPPGAKPAITAHLPEAREERTTAVGSLVYWIAQKVQHSAIVPQIEGGRRAPGRHVGCDPLYAKAAIAKAVARMCEGISAERSRTVMLV